MDSARKERPKYLNLIRIRLPITGVVSIIHRITGIILFLSLPVILFALEQSLNDANFIAHFQAWLSSIDGMLIALGVSISIGHHAFAGIRFLLLDLGIGMALRDARRGAWLVIIFDVLWGALCFGAMR